MAWYAAHLVMYFRPKDRAPKRLVVWENIVLISAKSEQDAFAKAEERGRQDAEVDDSSRVNGEPAESVFAGVRKLVLCQNENQRPTDGTEISYTEMEVRSEEAIHKLVAGEPVSVTIADVFPDDEPAADATKNRHLAKR